MNYLLQVFEDTEILGFSFPSILVLIAAGVFVYQKVYKKTWIPWYEAQKEKDEMIHIAFDEVKKYEEHRVHDREQSFAIQKQLTDTMDKLTAAQDDIVHRLDDMQESDRKYKLASIRGKLLDAYHYYANENSNPMMAWTEMEAHAFWEQFDTYVSLNGNGFMKDTVQPAMAKLDVVPMNHIDQITALMKSRSSGK